MTTLVRGSQASGGGLDNRERPYLFNTVALAGGQAEERDLWKAAGIECIQYPVLVVQLGSGGEHCLLCTRSWTHTSSTDGQTCADFSEGQPPTPRGGGGI